MLLPVGDYLRHILDETDYLSRYSRGLTKEKFLIDETLRRAFVRSIEIVGEAVKHIPDEKRKGYPNIEWRLVAGMRDRLIHGYFGVDHEIVWDVVVNKMPGLERVVKEMLKAPDD